ncbi:MAG: GNAT family N-acetyltransferase [Bacteroidia bacterium]|nr:GNAT family N-acetyltransferase [Bacteroidia bacterium]
MTEQIKCNSSNKDFINLVKLLDADLALRDGEDHSFYAQFNKIDVIKHALVLYQDNKPVSIGAIKEFDAESMEVKRMYTIPNFRGKGLAKKVLSELENWAHELGYKKCVLETGKRQPEAISLYKNNGYSTIPNYGQYIGIENSICFGKEL